MSNDWFNIRIFTYHIQSSSDKWLRISHNPYHVGYPMGRFRVYTLFGIHF